MSRIKTGSTYGCKSAAMVEAARMEAQGQDEEAIKAVLFGVAETPADRAKQTKKLRAWKRTSEYQECYRAIVREMSTTMYGRALARIDSQIDHDNPWVAQNAAREILNRFGDSIMGAEEKAVTIRIEGMPAIGSPATQTEALPCQAEILQLPVATTTDDVEAN